MKEIIELYKELDTPHVVALLILACMMFAGVKSCILAARGIDDDK